MSIRLIEEVLDHAPADLSLGERLLLIVIAEQARTDTRMCWPGQDLLMRRTGLGEVGLRRVMQRLAGRGLEVRVQLGATAKGRPLFAFNGRQVNYRLPRFANRDGGTDVPASPKPEGGTDVPPSPTTKAVRKVRTKPLKAVPIDSKGGTYVPPIPSVPVTKQSTPTRTPPADDVNRDLFGAPADPPNPVPLIVAAYVDSVRETGGVATSAMCGAIGKNAKRLIDVDKIHPAVIMVAAQRAGAKRTRALDQFLGDVQQSFDRHGESRRAMFTAWQQWADTSTQQSQHRQIGS